MLMYRIIITLLLALSIVSPLHAGEAPEKELARDNNAFALDLYDQILKSKDNAEKNLFFSPFSVSTALGMTYAGARGKTADQMKKVLHFRMKNKQLHSAYNRLISHLNEIQKKEELQLSVANALWGQKGYGFRKQYLQLTQKNYGAGLNQVNFKQIPEKVRGRINSWVADKTKNKIKNLMPKDSITIRTRLVLTNAIYFKARWANIFKEKATRKKPFKLLGGKKVKTPTMHQTDRFGYKETKTAKVLQLPYKGQQTSMFVILPKKDDGLPRLEKGLSAKTLSAMTDKMQQARVIVALPKFKLTSKFMLGDILKKMGMPDAFDLQKANFSGMCNKDLSIQAVVHKAYVDVYEKGTEAAAATGVSMRATSAFVGKPKTFRADHPFLFLIRDRQTGAILFMGRVLNPSK